MGRHNSLDELNLIAALLSDAHASNEAVFNTRALKNTINFVVQRTRSEGVGFLTKTMPRLGKHFDEVLTGSTGWNAEALEFKLMGGSKLPRFLGELFSSVFQQDGVLLPDADAKCVKLIRQILYLYYKYELPYDEVQEQQVINAFKEAEKDLSEMLPQFAIWHSGWHSINKKRWIRGPLRDNEDYRGDPSIRQCLVIREARRLLNELFLSFDPMDITPSHGPGVVSTKERLSRKFLWSNVSSRITAQYPFDAYFCASPGHVCDQFRGFDAVNATDQSAKVLLVPKDSRGPRLISCEPVDNQWIQQGLSRAIYRLVESHPITKWNVFFTDQEPNRRGALLGSSTGRYATLDLKEASDRVHLELVRLLFPERLMAYLECCRSTSTVLPSGEKLMLNKFAPMGSALCFPIMALTIWALLTAAAPYADTDSAESRRHGHSDVADGILVYGDDVIVPTTYVGSAMAILEEFGLKINRSKSCIQGSFRESCGMDAFLGVDVTPVRLRTVWKSSPRPDVYTSWISYANSFWDRRYYAVHEFIVERLLSIYGPVPSKDMNLSCPSLSGIPAETRLFKRRFNKHLQKVQYKVRVVKSPSVSQVIDGWSMLLRYFTEAQRPSFQKPERTSDGVESLSDFLQPFSVSRYTKRNTSMLVMRWR